MTRIGYTAEQQHQVKQLIFECSLAKMSSYQTQQVLKEKLDTNLTVSWINKIKAEFRADARKQYYHLLTDKFAYKYLTMEVMQQMHEIIRQQWDIANTHKGKNDLIALKALSDARESVLRVSEFYKLLPEVETNLFKLQVNNHNTQTNIYNNSNSNHEDFDNLDFDKENSLTNEDKELLRNGKAMIIGRDINSGKLIIDDDPELLKINLDDDLIDS
ncbi:MAG TPA: hypothetical protein VH500_12505 [Nitrososphaeraceae archaeon]|jgi:hypothetical protein